MKVTPLNAVSDGSRLIVRMLELSATGGASATEGKGETCGIVYVLEGRLDMDAGGMHEVLETGDCAYMESAMPIAMRAAGKRGCRVLTVTPPHTAH